MSLKVEKGTRHTKIVGIFGEYVVCNWLSRSGFEASVIDHTGMDIIAYDPKTRCRLGITVKSRTRGSGTETASVNIFRNKHRDREKLKKACKTFGCDPWIAVYVECKKHAELYLISLVHYDSTYRSKKKRVVDAWGMSPKSTKEYDSDPKVACIHSTFTHKRWPPHDKNRT
ncbi:MAG TPA: hypothetical protein VJY15_02830 [Candidatus Acidoferrum sp.]|nr:hypothetical protein [Candidatus Acidoferrum sp.]